MQAKLVSYKKTGRPEITGTNKTFSLKGVLKMVSIYVSRIEASSTIDSISDHLKDNGLAQFQVKLEYSKHPELYKSHIMSAPTDVAGKMKKADLWPEGANVSNFLYHLGKKKEKEKEQTSS
ncbi:hypothetical protein HHI36_001726 [Cryptolaemus montrouzieri]|uniref:Uncharacterized protein n=1 Tax=Cryptolaemus montrouzieri TaxID=559131 RepID=A0ABD2P8H1_9CUCU